MKLSDKALRMISRDILGRRQESRSPETPPQAEDGPAQPTLRMFARARSRLLRARDLQKMAAVLPFKKPRR